MNHVLYKPSKNLLAGLDPRVSLEIECHLFGNIFVLTCNVCRGQIVTTNVQYWNWRFELPCSYECCLKLFSGGIS